MIESKWICGRMTGPKRDQNVPNGGHSALCLLKKPSLYRIHCSPERQSQGQGVGHPESK